MNRNEFPDWLSEVDFLRLVIEIQYQVGTTVGGKELSIEDLFDYFDYLNPRVSDCVWIEEELSKNGILICPPICEGGNSEKRLFKVFPKPTTHPLEEISRGENQTQEFKSSFVYDRDRALHDVNAKLADLDSEAVLFSALKTIAGMINSEGGLLWLGVSDLANCIDSDSDSEIKTDASQLFPGLSDDCRVWGLTDERDIDSFELRVRGQIDSWFGENSIVNHSVEITFHEIYESLVCRVKVFKRNELVFLRDKNDRSNRKLWVRQGARTLETKITEFEEFLNHRTSKTNHIS
jgi:hypothetical protein